MRRAKRRFRGLFFAGVQVAEVSACGGKSVEQFGFFTSLPSCSATQRRFELPACSTALSWRRKFRSLGGNSDEARSCHWSGDSAGAERVLIPASELDLTKPLYVGVLDGRQGGIPSTSFAVPAASACAALSVVPAC